MALKIIATVRTRNEQENIERFCWSYRDAADEILVADGGSSDDTISIAEAQPKTSVLHFPGRMAAKGGHEINPQGRHVNFLIAEARSRGAGWIIFDDCDCVPNVELRPKVRQWIELAEAQQKQAVFARRIYMWGEDFHYPKLHVPNTSLWAFRANVPIRGDESDPWHLTMRYGSDLSLHNLRRFSLHLEFPACLLHFTWPSPEAAQAKINWYHQSGVQPGALHPDEFGGPRRPIEPFMRIEAAE